MRQGGFVNKVLNWARKNPTLRIVKDQIGSPTWARSLAEVTAQVLAMSSCQPDGWLTDRKGLYHLGGRGAVSRLDWARKIIEFDPHPERQVVQEVRPALTSDFPTPAIRPLYSPVDCSLFADIFGICLPDWTLSLQLALGVQI
jgi:dTDP-4-dehydrorhamnose reductase